MNCIISFSARKQGNCEQIAEFVRKKLQNSTGFCFSEFQIHPCGNCNYDCFTNREGCPYISDREYALLDAICRSETSYFVVPNYCDYPCANFFIFNERSQCYFQGHSELLEQYLNVPKKFIVVSNSISENFRLAFAQHVCDEPEILFLSAKRHGKNSISGDLMALDEVRTELEIFANGCLCND